MIKKTVQDINEYIGTIVNPLNTPDTMYELYSVPSFDSAYPEVLLGSEIGSSKVTVEENDVLVCKINPRINRVWIVKHNTEHQLIASSEWVIIRSPKNDARYLCYYFQSPTFRTYINSGLTGIGGSLTRAQPKQIAKYPVPIPDSDTQQSIADKLDKLHSIITHRKQQIAKLDELVKARFVELFGDVKTGVYKFETRKLGEVAVVGSSHRVFTTEFVENGVPFYRGTEIGELANGIKPENPYRITKEHYDRLASDETKPQIGDLLMPSICNKGQVWMVDTNEPFYYKDGRVLCISPNRELFNCKYLEQFMREKTLVEYPKLGSGSTFAEFKIFLLKDIDVLIPPIELQDQFAAFVEQTDKSKVAVQRALDEAQLLFDSLMQEYFG